MTTKANKFRCWCFFLLFWLPIFITSSICCYLICKIKLKLNYNKYRKIFITNEKLIYISTNNAFFSFVELYYWILFYVKWQNTVRAFILFSEVFAVIVFLLIYLWHGNYY